MSTEPSEPFNEEIKEPFAKYLEFLKLTQADLKFMVENHDEKLIVAVLQGGVIPLVCATVRCPSPANRKLLDDALSVLWDAMNHEYDYPNKGTGKNITVDDVVSSS